MNVIDLLKIVGNNDIIIYGAGYMAQSFFGTLQMRNLDDRVLCFAVSDDKKTGGKIHDKPIRAIDGLLEREDTYVCIAVHEVLKDECIEYLVKHNINKYIWVTPYIFELALGSPLECCVKIDINDIISHQSYDDYHIAVRYLAIENYYNKNNIGYDIYYKAQCIISEANSAQKRLFSFIQLIAAWEKFGYKEEHRLILDNQFRMIDGAHRLSVAYYHNMKDIYCDIYPYSDGYNILVRENGLLSWQMLKEIGLQPYELEAIENTQNKIRWVP